MNKTTVLFHSADFDGIFCREIAKKFLPDAELIGWDFADKPLPIPDGPLYVLDLPLDAPFGFDYRNVGNAHGPQHPDGLVWIDHHKSSIESHPTDIPGYRIDGVAACRLAWQWFRMKTELAKPENAGMRWPMPTKCEYVGRSLPEPLAVRLAGEYDIWDKRDPDAELFQHGLRSVQITPAQWNWMLTGDQGPDNISPTKYNTFVLNLLQNGKCVQYSKTQENAAVIKRQGFTVQWEGLTFLAANHGMFNSHLFTAGIKPEHDALLGFRYDGKHWHFSLYHAPGKEHHDLSLIAVKHGGGGHKGACGFKLDKLPF